MSVQQKISLTLETSHYPDAIERTLKRGRDLGVIYLDKEEDAPLPYIKRRLTLDEATHIVTLGNQNKDNFDFTRTLAIKVSNTYCFLTISTENHTMNILMSIHDYSKKIRLNEVEHLDLAHYITFLLKVTEEFPLLELTTWAD